MLRFLINLINGDASVLAAMADACSMVHLVCLLMKMHLLALLQESCLDLVHYAFLHKLAGCVRNITAFCQHLLRPIKSAVLADTDDIGKTKISARYIGLSLSRMHILCPETDKFLFLCSQSHGRLQFDFY